MRRTGIVTLGFAMAPFLLVGTPGCRPEADDTASTASTEAFKAMSPACTAARDACRAQTDPLIAAIKSACAPVEAACVHLPGHAADGGVAAGSRDGSAVSCDDARAACTNQIAMSKAALKDAGQSCEASIRMACTVSRGADGGMPRDPVSVDASAIPIDAGKVDVDAAGADPCKAAQMSCHQQLGQIRSMPPAECAAAQTACSGQGLFTASDACKMASAACQDALKSTVTSTLDSCSTAIASACAKHVH